MLKRRTLEENLPYQSLLASILQKYVSRSAPQTNEPVRFGDRYIESRIGAYNAQYKIRPH